MEVLSDILRSMRVTGSVYFCDYVEPPWSKEFADTEQANFHMIRRGQCRLVSAELEQHLGPGDFIYASPGRAHTLIGESLNGTGGPSSSPTLLLCGYCRFDAPLGHPLLRALPALTVVSAEELLEHAWLRSTLEQLSSEYMSQKPGSEVVVDKLTEVLLIELIRVNFGRAEHSGFIRALYDPQISAALAMLHDEPQRPWTLDELAAKAALSRAAFAKRFKQRVGQTMFEYLTHLRMHNARELLRGSRKPLYAVANEVGYESDIAFTKAFKRLVGVTPTQYRKQATESPR